MVQTRELRGLSAVEAVTALLSAVRDEDLDVGLWDAADIQWWWATDRDDTAVITIWSDERGRDIAYLVITGAKDENGMATEIAADFGWLPSTDDVARAEVVPEILHLLDTMPLAPGGLIVVIADERDPDLCRRLEAAGFERDPAEDMIQMTRTAATPVGEASLPPGFRIRDARSKTQDAPHHLARRNGDHVGERLPQCSHYRPELDLAVIDAEGNVAAYCLCWLDDRHDIGLVEPMRTEDAFQRRGIGRALMAEAVRRLTAGGAERIKLTRGEHNTAAAALYRGSGFVDANRNRHYQRLR